MKIILIILFGLFHESFAQRGIVPMDENEKYNFSEVIQTPGINAIKLFENGKTFMLQIVKLNSKSDYLIQDSLNWNISNKGSFGVHNYGSLKKHIDGEVSYDILLRIKDEKYQYTITNFIYTPYERDRYGQFVPVKGKNIPFEKVPPKLNNKNWINYREEVDTKTKDLILSLNAAMLNDNSKESEKTKKSINW